MRRWRKSIHFDHMLWFLSVLRHCVDLWITFSEFRHGVYGLALSSPPCLGWAWQAIWWDAPLWWYRRRHESLIYMLPGAAATFPLFFVWSPFQRTLWKRLKIVYRDRHSVELNKWIQTWNFSLLYNNRPEFLLGLYILGSFFPCPLLNPSWTILCVDFMGVPLGLRRLDDSRPSRPFARGLQSCSCRRRRRRSATTRWSWRRSMKWNICDLDRWSLIHFGPKVISDRIVTFQYLEADFVESLHDVEVRVRERRHVVELDSQLLHVPQGAAARGREGQNCTVVIAWCGI